MSRTSSHCGHQNETLSEQKRSNKPPSSRGEDRSDGFTFIERLHREEKNRVKSVQPVLLLISKIACDAIDDEDSRARRVCGHHSSKANKSKKICLMS